MAKQISLIIFSILIIAGAITLLVRRCMEGVEGFADIFSCVTYALLSVAPTIAIIHTIKQMRGARK